MANPRKYGNAPFKVAVVHGGPGAAGEMAPVAMELTCSRGILEPLQTEISLDGQVDELIKILKSKADLPITLIGYSWGAWLSYIVAAQEPPLVKKLILVSSGPFEAHYAARAHETRLSRLNEAEQAEIQSLTNVLMNSEVADSAVLARLGALFGKADTYDPIESESGESYTVECQPKIFRNVWPAAEELRKNGKLLELGKSIRCPVVAVHSDYDPHPAEGVFKPLSTVLKNFRWHLITHCGHTPWREKQAKDVFYQKLKEELI